MKGMDGPVLAAGGGEVVFSLQSPHLSWGSSPSRVPYQQTGTLARAHALTGLSTTKNPIVLINENNAQRDKPGHATFKIGDMT
jgi:hypothetical protein